ncbi:MAG TPA: TetR/AcrR family transcriptional regulator [Ferruginibacter sp.]|nr:TetR/AcrR family transcriptional regulator [Ferruginibacter sp.]
MSKIKASRNGSKKDTIAQRAAELFRAKGFVASSMREIADNIGVEASSLYNHIGSKSDLLQTICFKVAHDFHAHWDTLELQEIPVLEKLENLIRFHIHMMLDNFDEVYVANHEWKQLKEPHLSDFLQQRKRYETRMVNLIQAGIQSRELRPIHPHVAVLTILSAVRGLEFWQRHKKNISTKELENDIVHHLLNGITR